MSNDEEIYSDEEINTKQHQRLIDDVFQLDKKNLKKPSRTESSHLVSEFNLIKPENKKSVNISDLTKVLHTRTKHADIEKKIKRVQLHSETLNAPLEKPQAERIKRSVGYEKIQVELGKWQSIVTKNRVAEQLTFPLKSDEIEIKDDKNKLPFELHMKSSLEMELEKIEPVIETQEEPNKFPLNMKELLEKRKEMATLRAHQSYKEAKQFMKNKIKSKKYRRIERKDRLKKEIKEFEILQKTDPEAALKKLEQLEKTRAEERMTLRHRSTGQWAKNKQVRAKYDKKSRQALAQQLSLSRELTQKHSVSDSSDSELEESEQLPDKFINGTNPWIDPTKSEVDNFVSGYRKFWTEKNVKKEMKNTNIYISDLQREMEENVKKVEEEIEELRREMEAKNKNLDLNSSTDVEIIHVDLTDPEVTENNTKERENEKNCQNVKIENKEDSNKVFNKKEGKKIIKKKQKKSGKLSLKRKLKTVSEIQCKTKWEVTVIDKRLAKNESIDTFFEDLEYVKKQKVEEEVKNLKKRLVTKEPEVARKDKKDNNKNKKIKPDSLPRERIRPVIDEEIGVELKPHKQNNMKKLKDIAEDSPVQSNKVNIDPNKYINVKAVNLKTELPNIVTLNDSNNDQRAFIAEAFADDDILHEFEKEKQDIINKDNPKDIDMNIPGWGDWVKKKGTIFKRKNQRFIVKMPAKIPRRDDNKGNLILNEHKDTAVREHQVSEVPFPFKSVMEFEASIRMPIGDTFLPQTAVRRLIKPPIKTKKGTIIEPMDENTLLNLKFSKQGNIVNK